MSDFDVLRRLVRHAYEHGYHELGYDPVAEVESRLDSTQESYETAARHADTGWAYLKDAVACLHKIATQGSVEWWCREQALQALWNLPNAGAYDGKLPEMPNE